MDDYIAAIKAQPKDLQQAGVKGMKWGVRRSSAQLRAAARARGDAPEKKTESSDTAKKAASSTPANKPSGNIQDNVESSPARYARLAAQAKAGQASAMSEQDLKFFNARTDALAKVNKLNETQPGWLRETSVRVLQQSAQRQMQGIADSLADRYIGDPLKGAIGAKAQQTIEDAIRSGAAEKIRTKTIEDGIKAVIEQQTKTASSTTEKTAVPSSAVAAAAAKAASVVNSTASIKTSTSTPPAPPPKHRASLSDRAKAAAERAAQTTATTVANSKRSKADKQYEQTKKKIDDIEARKKSDPSLMTVSESIRYYKANPTTNPTPPAGLSPSAYRIWLDQIKRGE